VSNVKCKGLERCCEAARASAMAAHASAGLSLSWHKEAARLLRVAEALSRSAAALLDAAARDLRASPPPDAASAAGPAQAKPSRSARRRARKRGDPVDSAMDSATASAGGDTAGIGPVPGPAASPAGRVPARAPRVLKAHSSRERSPRRPLPDQDSGRIPAGEQGAGATLPDPSGAAGAESRADVISKPGACVEGAVMLLRGLVRRPALNDTRCRLLSLNKDSGRWAVALEDTDESIQVLPTNLSQCIFSQNFRSAQGIG
jgi:hypothetical protein